MSPFLHGIQVRGFGQGDQQVEEVWQEVLGSVRYSVARAIDRVRAARKRHDLCSTMQHKGSA
eukprot:1150795-Pelagomonas_calceolata.AAC.2